MNLNQVNLIGRLTRDPELKSLPNGTAVVTFGMATNHTYKDKDGEKKDQTTFHNLKAWGRMAETINQYMRKGSEMYVCGRIDNRSWEKPDGTKGYMTEIIVEEFQFGAKAKTGTPDPKEYGVPAEEEKEIPVDTIPF